MKTVNNGLFAGLPRLLMIAVLTAFLASCSSSGTTDGTGTDGTGTADPDDINGDGVIDFADGDYNGDGLVDVNDGDYNNDGVVDPTDDINGDGFVDAADFDINNDGFVDFDDDTNGDGSVNILDVPTDVALGPCKGSGGTDETSSNNQWDDNCVVTSIGAHQISSYSRGIQRILFCKGHADGASLTDFADGDFGPGTKAAVERFQMAENIGVDGKVGAETWGKLRDSVELLNTGAEYDSYGVADGACAGQVLFYNKLDGNLEGVSWEMAETPGSDVRVPFSMN